MTRRPTVFVGLSGGVDSSVAALRLKNQGFSVVGVFIKVWHPDFMVCNWEQERLDAMRVAAHLDIPFLTCDGEAAYKDKVAEYFIAEYKAGRTPNPDVLCNKEVKFGVFLDFAKARGADYIATGHYAQKIDTPTGAELHRGVDTEKDQSYFLWSLSPEQLAFALFPVGNSPKSIIRAEAKRAGIPVATKKDSQGICFLGHVDIPSFLSHYTALLPGAVHDETGATIGEHKGALVYTLGQRHGFTLNTHDPARKQLYVIGKDIEKNIIIVGEKPPTIKSTETIPLISCVLRKEVKHDELLTVQFRYRQTPLKASLNVLPPDNTTPTLTLLEVADKPAAGQSCVIYRGSACLGGGIIH
jgi:tRNA-uridine 2-sulfurtransferase